MPREPRTVDEYLACVDPGKREALERLRRAIHAAAPGVEERISYRIPAFSLGGRMLVAFGAAARHCAFYPGAYPLVACRKELKGYDLSKGTIRFQPEKPLPLALVRNLVKARIAEKNVGAYGTKRGR